MTHPSLSHRRGRPFTSALALLCALLLHLNSRSLKDSSAHPLLLQSEPVESSAQKVSALDEDSRASKEGEGRGDKLSEGAPHEPPLGLRVALGVYGSVQGNFMTKPKDEYYQQGNGYFDIPYPGFGRVSGAGGAQLDVAWRYFALSVGYRHSLDSAEGKLDGQTVTMSQDTHHVPLTLSVTAPGELIRPMVFGGLDWVSASNASLEVPPSYQNIYTGLDTEPYQAWTFGAGFDIVVHDKLSVPIRFYGVFNSAPRDTLNDVVVSEDEPLTANSTLKMRGEWTWQTGVSIGVSYDLYTR